MKYICTCFLGYILVIANSIMKQRIIPEYHTGVYHKGDNNANDRKSIFDVSHDYVYKKVVSKENTVFLADIDIDKLLFKNPRQVKLSPATPFQAP